MFVSAAQRGPERTAKVVGVLVKCECGADTHVSCQQTTDTHISCQQTTETKPQAARAAAEGVASADVGVVIKLESEPVSDSEPDSAYPIAFWAGTNLRSLLTMPPAAFPAR